MGALGQAEVVGYTGGHTGFFGSRPVERNMIAMLRSVTAFLDLHRIRTTMTSEYILKS